MRITYVFATEQTTLKRIPIQTWYRDADGDGYGNPYVSVLQTDQPDRYVDNNKDCDDDDPNVH